MGRRKALHPAFDVLARVRKKQARSRLGPKSSPPPVPRPVQPGDRELFLSAIGDVTPLPESNQAEIGTLKPKPVPRPQEPDSALMPEENLAGPVNIEGWLGMEIEDTYLRTGFPRRTLTDLRRGRWAIQAELDLHGLIREEAGEVLTHFLADCRDEGLRCIRIIHGRGLSSPGGKSVLKAFSRHWLASQQDVVAFCQTNPRDGGEGALLVLLNSPWHKARG